MTSQSCVKKHEEVSAYLKGLKASQKVTPSQAASQTEPCCDPAEGLDHMLRTAQQLLQACAKYYGKGSHANLHGRRLRETLGRQADCARQWLPGRAAYFRPKFFQLDFGETDDRNSADEKPSQIHKKRPHGHPPQMQECLLSEQKVDPSSERSVVLDMPKTWEEVVNLLEDTTVPFKSKEISLLAFVEEPEGWMVENSLEWQWCSTVIQALYIGCDITEEVGAITGRVPGAQTVFRGELYAVLQLARYTSGTVDATLDCKGVLKRIRSVRPGKTHSDLWWALRPTGTHRLQMTWVPSHVKEQEFLQAVGQDHL